MHPADTNVLVAAARNGDTRSLEALLLRHRRTLLDRIRIMLGTNARRIADSADFLQDVMVDIMRGLQSFEPRGERAFLRWALRIARNNIADAASKRHAARFADIAHSTYEGRAAPGTGPASEAAANEAVDRLVEAIERLNPEHQETIELRDFEGLSFEQIGARMQRSANAAQLLHSKAMLRLGRLLDAASEE